MFCCTLLYVHSSIAIIFMGKRELVALLDLSSWCLVMVERLFFAVPQGYLRFVIVLLPDHTHFFACGALAPSISVGIVIPSTWFVYLYKQTVSITVVVMGTKQFNDKTTHLQQVKTGFVQKWEMGKQKFRTFTGLFQDFTIFKDSISSQFCITSEASI